MRISVVTPSFNMAPYLEDTITSVIGNLRPGDEYFVIDGGSTDGSADVIRRHEQSLSGWVSEKDAGYADALAKGFDRATGDIHAKSTRAICICLEHSMRRDSC
jgi:glycosyltransferase involved in cell wall biosynthesis